MQNGRSLQDPGHLQHAHVAHEMDLVSQQQQQQQQQSHDVVNHGDHQELLATFLRDTPVMASQDAGVTQGEFEHVEVSGRVNGGVTVAAAAAASREFEFVFNLPTTGGQPTSAPAASTATAPLMMSARKSASRDSGQFAMAVMNLAVNSAVSTVSSVTSTPNSFLLPSSTRRHSLTLTLPSSISRPSGISPNLIFPPNTSRSCTPSPTHETQPPVPVALASPPKTKKGRSASRRNQHQRKPSGGSPATSAAATAEGIVQDRSGTSDGAITDQSVQSRNPTGEATVQGRSDGHHHTTATSAAPLPLLTPATTIPVEETVPSLACPVCKVLTPLPPTGLRELAQFTFVRTLAGLSSHNTGGGAGGASVGGDAGSASEGSMVCEICEQDFSSFYCTTCLQYFCDACHRPHKKVKTTASHEFVSAMEAREVKVRHRAPPCPSHQEEVKVFCFTCEMGVCLHCALQNHSTHQFQFLRDIGETLQGEIGLGMQQAQDTQTHHEKTLEKVSCMMEEVAVATEATKSDVKAAFRHLRQLLDQREDQALTNLENYRQHKTQEMTTQKDAIQHLLASFRTATLFATTLLNEGNDLEVLESHRILRERFKVLAASKGGEDSTGLAGCSVRFTDPAQAALVHAIQQYGHVVTGDPCPDHSYVDTSALDPAGVVAHQKVTFLIVAVDEEGARLKAGGQRWNVAAGIEGSNGSDEILIPPSVTDNGDGTHTAWFLPSAAGRLRISVRLGSRDIRGSPFSLSVLPPPLGSSFSPHSMSSCSSSMPFSGSSPSSSRASSCSPSLMLYSPPSSATSGARDYGLVGAPELVFGENGEGEGQFRGPRAVCCNANGDIVVADTDLHRIQVFSPRGELLRVFGSQTRTEDNLSSPKGICTDRQGNIIVADTEAHLIKIFGPTGKLTTILGEGENRPFNRPVGVAVDKQGQLLVANLDGHRVDVFDQHKRFVRHVGGGDSGQLNSPFGLATDSDSNIIVTDIFDSSIQVFSPMGDLIRVIIPSEGRAAFAPQHVAVDLQNHILVADPNNRQVRVFDLLGNELAPLDTGQIKPTGLAVDPQGRIVICDRSQNRVSVT